MDDDEETAFEELEEEPVILPPAPMGPWFWAVMAMIGILLLMILYGQVQGITHPIEVNLTDTQWTLSSYADAQGTMVPVKDGAGSNISFGLPGDGTLRGMSGCTAYSYQYVRNATSIHISDGSIISGSCDDPGTGNATSLYFSDLTRASGLRFRSGQIFVSDAAGRPLLVFDLAGT
ncbi:hypothetical protein Mboo_1162 [Methanoregula boonei 6A8]|uniref:DUF306 domain-containing protein n=1 Tax=Methanoregula boonei (strain DSM 21154 / JCM 14090 / 6A8) TaxID=456442 RepID=A7I7G9_METB6|nr:META domain-containing protein [Methanoregula boonei]ABS55680.1 hypothetical protein Mboo_1162 [Methanoregula boonei 6A8]